MTEEHKRELASRFGPTTDTFMAAVPWGESRTVLVHRRIHGHREYVRLRTWNRHRTKRVWYPSKRFFIIPVQSAEALGEAILRAVEGLAEDKPDWLVEREVAEDEQLERMAELGISAGTIEREQVGLDRERRERV